MRPLIAAALFASLPVALFAAGGNMTTTTPPKPTETTTDCFSERQWDPEKKAWVRYSKKVNGVWDPKIQRCVRPDKASSLDLDTLRDAVRELAYAGRLEDAQTVLSQMPQDDDLVLTYWGFTHRKLGNQVEADEFYARAIATNANNLLARSYMGQGFVTAGKTDEAIAQWREIKARGGDGTWAEASLREAIRSGLTYNY
ncbi:tetratricopeptide repeat protein [Lutimaribacter marinistellae]|uniref:Tetratricopeptide repeat protein n=1 Tax=Lutimaribacter marinistellae TaxID=1820329 RepID=A0ABV7TL47_9RHOB